jgi:hypothetical protein
MAARADSNGNGNFIPLLIDIANLVAVYPAPGGDIVQHTRIGAHYLD